MCKCVHCKGEVPELGGILVTIDGDFACSQHCEQEYIEERDKFYRDIIPSPQATEQWLLH